VLVLIAHLLVWLAALYAAAGMVWAWRRGGAYRPSVGFELSVAGAVGLLALAFIAGGVLWGLGFHSLFARFIAVPLSILALALAGTLALAASAGRLFGRATVAAGAPPGSAAAVLPVTLLVGAAAACTFFIEKAAGRML